MKCTNCRRKIKRHDLFCSNCGYKVNKFKGKYKIVICIVAIFLVLFAFLIGILFFLREKEKNNFNNRQKSLEFANYAKGILDNNSRIDNPYEFKEIDKENMQMEICDKVIKSYGEASGEIFFSSDGSEFLEFPSTAGGYISSFLKDFNDDGSEELLVVYITPSDWKLYVEIYNLKSAPASLQDRYEIGKIDSFSQITMYMFENSKNGQVMIFYSNNTMGSYSGTYSFSAKLLIFDSYDDIEVKEWSWDNIIDGFESLNLIQTEMQNLGITYLEAGRASFGQFDPTQQILLAKSEIGISGDFAEQYIVNMQIFNSQQLKEYVSENEKK